MLLSSPILPYVIYAIIGAAIGLSVGHLIMLPKLNWKHSWLFVILILSLFGSVLAGSHFKVNILGVLFAALIAFMPGMLYKVTRKPNEAQQDD